VPCPIWLANTRTPCDVINVAGDGDYDDLRGFDLSRLELDHIELDSDKPPSPAWRWVVGLSLLGMAVGIYLLGQNSAANGGLSFILSIGAVVLGLTIGRWLWMVALDRAAQLDAIEIPEEPVGPPSALARWLTLLVGGGSAVAIVVLVRNGQLQAWFGEGALFAAAAVSIVVGIVLGRWLMLQGEAARYAAANNPDEDNERIQINVPPWFKWVTLAGIIVVAGGVVIWSNLDSETSTTLAGVGFACGIAAAVWVAKRFDEVEGKDREAREERKRLRALNPNSDSVSARNVRHLPVGKSNWKQTEL
jgi:hypothetical protein